MGNKFVPFESLRSGTTIKQAVEEAMAKTEEGKIQNAIIKYAGGFGVHTIRMYFGPGMQTGWPDVLFLLPSGTPLFIEFKVPGKTPTAKQNRKIGILEEAGYHVEVCDNLVAGKQLIDDYLYAIGSGNL